MPRTRFNDARTDVRRRWLKCAHPNFVCGGIIMEAVIPTYLYPSYFRFAIVTEWYRITHNKPTRIRKKLTIILFLSDIILTKLYLIIHHSTLSNVTLSYHQEVSSAPIWTLHIANVFFLPINSLQNDKILEWSKMEVFADNQLNVVWLIGIVTERLEVLWEKDQMLVTSVFHVPPPSFSHIFKWLL